MAHAIPPHDRSESALSIPCDDCCGSLSCLGGIALRFRELIVVFLRANRVGHCERRHRSRPHRTRTYFLASVAQSCTMALPPTSSASTLAGRRAIVVQTPTASPIVVAVPRGVVTTHCRSWGLAHSRCEARWLLYELRRLPNRAWHKSLPPATSGDTEYRWSCLFDPLASIR